MTTLLEKITSEDFGIDITDPEDRYNNITRITQLKPELYLIEEFDIGKGYRISKVNLMTRQIKEKRYKINGEIILNSLD